MKPAIMAYALVASASAVVFTSCSGVQQAPIGISASQRSASRPTSPAKPANPELNPTPILYVSAEYGSFIRVYDQAGKHQSPIRTIRNGLVNPSGMSVTPNGDLWVADLSVQGVLVYRRGASSPFKILSEPGESPNDVAVDKSGNAYAFNIDGTIDVFAKGHTSPTSTLTIPGSIGNQSGAFDAAGNLYVVFLPNGSIGDIAEFVGGQPPAIDLHAPGLTRPVGIAFDNTGDAFVADSYVNVYDLPNIVPESKLNLFIPYTICFSGDFKHLYILDGTAPFVLKYTYPGLQLVDTIRKGLIGNGHEFIAGIAADPPAQP